MTRDMEQAHDYYVRCLIEENPIDLKNAINKTLDKIGSGEMLVDIKFLTNKTMFIAYVLIFRSVPYRQNGDY